ncbi:MAG: hypothetical protein KatS3mg106_259 [Gemmataceae bacterium]|nr:MAG: hypothetical protein KatS3mg106_259 [Gemmataceae bacterium]
MLEQELVQPWGRHFLELVRYPVRLPVLWLVELEALLPVVHYLNQLIPP